MENLCQLVVQKIHCSNGFFSTFPLESFYFDGRISQSKLVVQSGRVRSGKITWRSPSNIALIKYWGKYGQQMPCNPSLSFTLDAAYTETTLEYGIK
jgi:mevalonate pyrophosphate decarboxylase